jgi:hypothetical protein
VAIYYGLPGSLEGFDVQLSTDNAWYLDYVEAMLAAAQRVKEQTFLNGGKWTEILDVF